MRHFTDRQILKLTWDESEEGTLIHKEIDDKMRFSILYSGIVKMHDDGLYYKIEWLEYGEDLDEVEPWEQDAPEVEPVGEVAIRSAFVPKGESKHVLVAPSDKDPLYDNPTEWRHLLEAALEEAAS